MRETSNHKLRLTFRYEGMDVQLMAIERLDMITPPGAPEPIRQGQAGFWAELLDADERPLYQRMLHNPIRHEMEAPVDDETGTLRWYKIDHPRGIFQVLVPDVPEGETLVLFSSPPEAVAEPATELARFSLDAEGISREVTP